MPIQISIINSCDRNCLGSVPVISCEGECCRADSCLSGIAAFNIDYNLLCPPFTDYPECIAYENYQTQDTYNCEAVVNLSIINVDTLNGILDIYMENQSSCNFCTDPSGYSNKQSCETLGNSGNGATWLSNYTMNESTCTAANGDYFDGKIGRFNGTKSHGSATYPPYELFCSGFNSNQLSVFVI